MSMKRWKQLSYHVCKYLNCWRTSRAGDDKMRRFTHVTAQQSFSFRASLSSRIDSAYHWTSRYGASTYCHIRELKMTDVKFFFDIKNKRTCLFSLCLKIVTISDVDHISARHTRRKLDHLGTIVERSDLQRNLLTWWTRRRHVQISHAGVDFHHCNNNTLR